MKNKFLRVFSIIGLVIATTSLSVSCNPEDGVNGIDGVDGADGENGIGFDDLTQYGSISLTMTGTRPDDVAFSTESEFKFIHNDPGNNNVYLSDGVSEGKNEGYIEFNVTRFIQNPNSDDDNSIEIELEVYDAGMETENYDFYIEIEDFAPVFDDLKYIEFDDSFYSDNVDNFSISDYSYDDATGNLKFSFSFDVDGDNSTGNDLSISGTVDVVVFEEIYDEEENFRL